MTPRKFYPGEFYHLYNRGNAREPIFFEPENYRFFLSKARNYLANQTADIVAYCLMPNHYHFLVQVKGERLSDAMHTLGMGYAKAINKRLQRSGHLFQGVFQDKHVKTTPQLLHLSRYIHLNPVRANLVNRAEDWEYSSYPEFVGERAGTLASTQAVMEHFANQHAYQDFVTAPGPDDQDILKDVILE